MNADRDNLLAALVRDRWATMLVLADEAEDRGDPWLASGWRWMSATGRWPAYLHHYVSLGLFKGGGMRKTWGWRGCGGQFGHDLPGAVFNRLKGGTPRRLWRRWDSEEGGLLAAAVAAGEMLRWQQEKKREDAGA